MKTVNANTSKKAQSLAKKLVVERTKLQKSSEAIGKILLTTDLIIGGYKMVQKLRKQKSLFDSLVEVINDRIKIFEETSQNVVKTK
jgi:hypothetical protein